jgi:hypothetical protein
VPFLVVSHCDWCQWCLTVTGFSNDSSDRVTREKSSGPDLKSGGEETNHNSSPGFKFPGFYLEFLN